MPYWCKKLLQSHGAPFFALAMAVHTMDLTTSTKVKRYHCHHKQHAQLEANQCAIIAKIEREDEELTTSAKVERYHHHHEWHAQLKADQHAIIAEIEREDEELTSIHHHLKGWHLHE